MAEAIAQAANDTGIALTLLPVFYAHSGFGGVPPTEGQRRFLHTPDSYARLLEALQPLNATLGVAPTACAPSLRRNSPPSPP